MKRSELKADVGKVREFHARARANSNPKRRPISPASPAQREAVHGRACIVCGETRGVDPSHVIDRSLCGEGADDPRAVVALCRQDHRAFDEGSLDLLPYLEPRFRVELAYAVERFGLISTLERVTGDKWRPKEKAA